MSITSHNLAELPLDSSIFAPLVIRATTDKGTLRVSLGEELGSAIKTTTVQVGPSGEVEVDVGALLKVLAFEILDGNPYRATPIVDRSRMMGATVEISRLVSVTVTLEDGDDTPSKSIYYTLEQIDPHTFSPTPPRDFINDLFHPMPSMRRVHAWEGYPLLVYLGYSSYERGEHRIEAGRLGQIDTMSPPPSPFAGVITWQVSDGKDAFFHSLPNPTGTGTLDLELVAEGQNFTSMVTTPFLFIYTRDTCGIYMRWFARDGSTTYWLFSQVHKHEEATDRGRQLVSAPVNVRPVNTTTSPHTSLPVSTTVSRELTVYAHDIHNADVAKVTGVMGSPYVELYIGEQGEIATDDKWVTVVPAKSKQTVDKSNAGALNFEFTFTLPKPYAQSPL